MAASRAEEMSTIRLSSVAAEMGAWIARWFTTLGRPLETWLMRAVTSSDNKRVGQAGKVEMVLEIGAGLGCGHWRLDPDFFAYA